MVRTLHYVWVGNTPLPPLVKTCIESWRRYMPQYEVKCWNEENIPMDHPYVQEMYRKKKWAFVSDYVRFWVLYHEGGIYLDTDMEVTQPLDQFLNYSLFFGKTKDGFVACGIIGSIPHHPFIKDVLSFYDADIDFNIQNTSPKIVTRLLQQHAYTDISVFEPEVFYPCNDGEVCSKERMQGAYTTHHWAESWVSFSRLRKVLRRIGLMSFLKRVFRPL